MKETKVEIIVDNVKDSLYYNKEIEIIRDGEKRKIIQKLLMKGDILTTTSDHAKYLISLGYAQEYKGKDFKSEE